MSNDDSTDAKDYNVVRREAARGTPAPACIMRKVAEFLSDPNRVARVPRRMSCREMGANRVRHLAQVLKGNDSDGYTGGQIVQRF